MRKFRKILALALVVLSISCVLIGCNPPEDLAFAGKTRLVVWSANPLVHNYMEILALNPNDKKALLTKKIITDFEKENADKNVKIQLVFKGWGDSLNENLLKAVKTQEYMDLVPGEMYIRSYMKEGYFSEISEGSFEGKLVEPPLARGKMDGKTYALPIFTSGCVLVANKFVLRESGIIDSNDKAAAKYETAGIDPLNIKYWEDLLLISRDVKSFYSGTPSKGGTLMNSTSGGGQSFITNNYMVTAGGAFVDSDDNFTVNSAENLKAYQLMRDLVKTAPDKSIGSQNGLILYNYINENKAAYIVDTFDVLIRAQNKPSNGHLSVSEIPTYKENGVKANTIIGTVYYSVMEQSKNKELAQKFIHHLMKEEYQLENMALDYRVPISKDILSGEAIKTNANYDIMLPLLNAYTSPEYNFGSGVPSLIKNAGSIWDAWNSFVKKVYTSESSIKGLADSANATMNSLKDR